MTYNFFQSILRRFKNPRIKRNYVEGLPDIFWPENRIGTEDVVVATLDYLGEHPWLALSIWRGLDDTREARIMRDIPFKRIRVNDDIFFVAEGQHSKDAVRAFFEVDAVEWTVMGFAEEPTGDVIASAYTDADMKPAQRYLHFDGNALFKAI